MEEAIATAEETPTSEAVTVGAESEPKPNEEAAIQVCISQSKVHYTRWDEMRKPKTNDCIL